MYTHNLSTRAARNVRPTGLVAGLAVMAALFSAACGDSASSITSPALFSHSGHGGSAGSDFAVLANAAVTCTGGSITGDVGTYEEAPPAGDGAVTLTEGCDVDASIHIGDAAAVQAYEAFLAQYAALAPQPEDDCPVITGTLADVTLSPGVYCVSAEAKTGVLTLKGSSNATWIIKVPNGALTGTNFTVILEGGAQPCNVTWWVDAAVTMSTSSFEGNILAGEAITMTGGTLNGNAWAGADGAGDVTFTGTTVVGCEGSARGNAPDREKCNQGVGNGPEGCDPGDSNHRRLTNDEDGGIPGNPGRKGGGR